MSISYDFGEREFPVELRRDESVRCKLAHRGKCNANKFSQAENELCMNQRIRVIGRDFPAASVNIVHSVDAYRWKLVGGKCNNKKPTTHEI